MIAPQTGHDLTPVNREDAARLRELHVMCSEANLREVKKFAVHYPHLFQVADIVGNTALHYAAMSGRADFVEEVLQIYHRPQTFLHFNVEFKHPEDLEGLAFSHGGAYSPAAVLVSRASTKRHGRAGIMLGDGLEAVSFPIDAYRGRLGRARPDPQVKDVVRALENGELKSFPLIFRFCRSALVGIFAQDTWHHVEAAATETRQHPEVLREGLKILRLLRKEKELLTRRRPEKHHAAAASRSEPPPMLPALPNLSGSSPRFSRQIPMTESRRIFVATSRGFTKSNSVPIMSWSNKAVDRANWSLPR